MNFCRLLNRSVYYKNTGHTEKEKYLTKTSNNNETEKVYGIQKCYGVMAGESMRLMFQENRYYASCSYCTLKCSYISRIYSA